MSDKLIVSKVESKGYGNIYKLPMLDRDLDVVAKAFYAYLCSFAGQGETAFPSMDKICHDLNVSRQRLERHRKALVDKGYITINQIKEKGKFARNEYVINRELKPLLQNATTEKPTTEKPTMDFNTTNNNSINNNSINNNSINNNNKDICQKFSTFDLEAAQLLERLILQNNPNFKKKDIYKWAESMRLIRERDGRNEKDIVHVITWCQNDDFWCSNILSPDKLRKQFDRLYIAMNKNNKPRNVNNQYGALEAMVNQYKNEVNSIENGPTNNRLAISENNNTLF